MIWNMNRGKILKNQVYLNIYPTDIILKSQSDIFIKEISGVQEVWHTFILGVDQDLWQFVVNVKTGYYIADL